jgi:ribonucleoside-diphosphate reductase beta chain
METMKKPQLTEERTTFKPFKYPWAYDAWLQHEQSHWLHTEVPMGEDLKDYQNKLNQRRERILNQDPTLLCSR